MALFSKHSDKEFAQVLAERDDARATIAELEKLLAELQVQCQTEIDRTQQATDKLSAAEKQVADLTAKVKAEADKAKAEADKAKDLQEENDLLLAQLHQVQEELEKYYLDNKDLEGALSEATSTLRATRHSLVTTLLDARGFVLPTDEADHKPASSSGNGVTMPSRARHPRKLPTLPRPPGRVASKRANRTKRSARRTAQ